VTRTRKPRTNAETAQYWADSILADVPADPITVNSVIVRSDAIFSFGSHYPMGVIVRNERGRTLRVVLNNDRYPSRGWANTPGDQWEVRMSAEAACAKRKEIRLQSVPLTHYRWSTDQRGDIQVRPDPNDPEPERYPRTEVERWYECSHPGPEPVCEPHLCVVGKVTVLYSRCPYCPEVHPSYAGECYFGLRTTVHTFKRPDCATCKSHDERHEHWRISMNGGHRYNGSNYRRVKGYRYWCEMVEKFGSLEAWQSAYRNELRRVREARKLREEWYERNYIPTSALTCDRIAGVDIPRLDAEGYPLKKDIERYWLGVRERERQATREERERERREAEERRVEAFKARIRREREKNPTIEQLTGRVMRELSYINERLRPNNSQEVTT
jgi:hypothetical protein